MKRRRYLWKHLTIASLTLGLTGLVGLLPEFGTGSSNLASAQTGGRTRGGSFDSPAPSQAPSNYPSGGGYTSPSYDYSPYDYSYPPSRPDYFPGSYRRPRVIVMPPQSYPVPVDPGYGYGTGSSGDGLFLFLIMACGICVLPVLMSYMRASRGTSHSGSYSNGAASELTNEVITVTQLQIALLAQARYIQEALTQLSLQADLDSKTGLADFLRETVLALLRSPEYWSHARVSSQTVKSRAQASQLFEQLSIQERSKLSAETLVNVGGQIRRQTVQVNQEADPASYIVVTLLLGTADDKPLASTVHSAAELSTILKRLGGVSPDYLMVYELIWSPQDASDSLSRDQLLANYADLIQIA
jgi:uncharacterized membrane protein